MIGPIEAFMTADHARLDALLRRADRDGAICGEAYEAFRAGLLRHIAMEEKILMPMARSKRGGEPLPIARVMRLEHGQIAKLLVPTPDAALVRELRLVLAAHNGLEEGPNGLYATCDSLAALEAPQVVVRLCAQPEVPVAKHYDGPLLRR